LENGNRKKAALKLNYGWLSSELFYARAWASRKKFPQFRMDAICFEMQWLARPESAFPPPLKRLEDHR
jgi:hypothetical protein